MRPGSGAEQALTGTDSACGGLRVETVTHEELTWVNIVKPTQREMDWLAQRYPFHALDLDDCLSRVQLPKIDEYEEYLFVIFHFPVFSREERVTRASQVAAFIGEDYVVTVHQGDLRPLVRLFELCRSSEEARRHNMGRSSGYLLYRILDGLVDYCFPILHKIIGNIERAEDQVFSRDIRETVEELSVLRRDVLSYRRIIRPQIAIVTSLERKRRPLLEEEGLAVYFGDIADHINRIWEELQEYKEVVEGLNDTNNSLTSHRINEVMRVLTIISTVMLPLSVVSGIYGMNLPLPFERSPYSFAAVMGVMVAIVAGMLAFFRIRRWI